MSWSIYWLKKAVGGWLPIILNVLLLITLSFGVLADEDRDESISLRITKAGIDGDKLVVSARLSERSERHRFTLYDITDEQVLLARSERTRDREIEFEIKVEHDATPCRIRVDVDRPRVSAAADVENCTGGETNHAPVCAIDTPANDVTINAGEVVNFTATVTDNDGDALNINWSFAGGVPAASNQEAPGFVNYGTPGNYIAVLNATDTKGAGCPTVTRNISVLQNGGTPPPPLSGEFTVLAANDLGMHCADLDFSIFSILPPFNVVHAQLIKKGSSNSLPAIIDNSQAGIFYSATSSPFDPVQPFSINTTSAGKSNFWDDSGSPNPVSFIAGNNTWGGLTYRPLYPSVLAAMLLDPPVDLSSECSDPVTPTGCPSILDLFEPIPVDVGIPVPDLVELGTGVLVASQQQMPGLANTDQAFARFDTTVPFYTGFAFGAELPGLNWWAADGIPVLPVDDSSNPNSYPLMKVTAKDLSGNALSSLDVVTPVASEADCQNCHVNPLDCQAVLDITGDASLVDPSKCIGAAVGQIPFVVEELPDYGNSSPTAQQVLEDLRNTAKINILRLHDAKYGSVYTAANGASRQCADPSDDPGDFCLDNRRAIQCSQCHYSPALDLTQQGPQDEPEQGANGRQQTRHVTMSRAMHGHHGRLYFNGEPLFPEMPAPVDTTTSEPRDPMVAEQVLNETCYQCHPGKKTQCLRGAMFAGGVVCQDCHGNMAQVGNDFSIRVSSGNPGDFVMDGSLRVPWAFEPGCQSCHTGDALNKNHPAGPVLVADDGIRLLQAYQAELITVSNIPYDVDVAATIKSPTSRFAENQAVNGDGATVDVLYRLSKGHGEVMCEGCHNSTHAIWPNAMANANDNVASDQLQGHHGTLIECSTCHGENSFGIDDFKGNLDANGQMKGPHGMHPVNDPMWNEKHKEVDKGNNRNSCRACHGINGEGSVLSRVAADRTLECKDENWGQCVGGTLHLSKGDVVSCTLCHENEINDD